MNHSEFQSLKTAYESQSLSAKKFCESNGVPYQTWMYWSRKARDQDSPAAPSNSFLQILPEEALESYSATIESPTGWRVHVSTSLAEILAALPA